MEEERREGSFRIRFLLMMAGILVIVFAVGIVILINTGVKEKKYASAVKLANHYYTAGNYENAIIEYENAIQINQKKETAYLNLASVYMLLGEYSEAEEVLERGLAYINSKALQEKKVSLQTLISEDYGTGGVQPLTAEEIAENSRDVSVENAMFDMTAAYTYTEYFRDYGAPGSQKKEDGKVWLYYGNLDFYAVYYDLSDEKVLDPSGSMPVATAKPNEIRFQSLLRIFSEDSKAFAISKDKLSEIFEGARFYQEESSGRWYMTAEYKGCRFTVETDESGNIVSETAWNKLEPLNRSGQTDDAETDGEVSGYVQDAMTGKGMKATLKIRDRGRRAGAALEEIQSGPDGSYTYEGKQGTYTAEVSAAGYITEYLDFEVVRGQVKTGKNVVLSPEVNEGEIRIVLTWGSSPSDLDAYAIGTASDNRSFNIHFMEKNISGIGNLDVDDTTGYGPETITITDTGADFTYSVMDYRLEGTMPSSGATVKVYLPGSSSAATYKVPSGEGVLWEVFRYENGEISGLNRLYMEDEIPANSMTKWGF